MYRNNAREVKCVDDLCADTPCAVGSICPAGTAVSTACADRSAFDESPPTALEQLAALLTTLSSQAPWSDLASAAYCDDESYLEVDCATVDGVQLPTFDPPAGCYLL